MKKYYLYLILSLAFLTACDKNDSGIAQKQIIDNSDVLEGEWVSLNANSTFFTNILMANNGRSEYKVIQNEVGLNAISDKDEGSWTFYNDGQTLSLLLMSHQISGLRVVYFDGNKMLLNSIKYNTEDYFYRVVESIELEAGQTVSISFVQNNTEWNNATCSTINDEVLDVSANGIVKGKQEGITFISIEIGEEKVYARVKVKGRITRYAEETHMLIDDILEKYGEPTGAGSLGGNLMGVQYIHPSLDEDLFGLQYTYHKYTHEIKLIQTIYDNPIPFKQDWDYIDHFFFHQYELSETTYTEKEKFWANEYDVTCLYDRDGYHWINYRNLDFVD